MDDLDNNRLHQVLFLEGYAPNDKVPYVWPITLSSALNLAARMAAQPEKGPNIVVPAGITYWEAFWPWDTTVQFSLRQADATRAMTGPTFYRFQRRTEEIFFEAECVAEIGHNSTLIWVSTDEWQRGVLFSFTTDTIQALIKRLEAEPLTDELSAEWNPEEDEEGDTDE